MSRHRVRGRAAGVTSSILGLLGQLGLSSPVGAAPADGPPPVQAGAEDETSVPTAPAPDDDDTAPDSVLAEARARRHEGAPLTALPLLEEALERLDPATLRRDPDLRALLLLELATAHDASFSLDADVEHLHRARGLLDRLVAEAEVHGYAAVLVDRALSMRDRVDERLMLGPPSSAVIPRGASSDGAEPSRRLAGRGWRIAGWTLTGLGLGATGASVAGLVLGRDANRDITQTDLPSHEPLRIDAIDRGQRSNRLAMGAGIAAGTLLTIGVTSVVIGLVLRRRARTGGRTARPTAGHRASVEGGSR